MIDHRSVFLWLTSNFITILGLISLNAIAIWIGILAGVTTVAWNVVNIYLKIKESKKDNANRSSK